MLNEKFNTIGNINLLTVPKTAFLCSQSYPASTVLKAYDWAKEQREKGNCVISGFHSTLEKDVFDILQKGSQPIIIVLARGFGKNIRSRFQLSLNKGNLLVISPFDENVKRITKETTLIRNQLIANISDDIVLGYVTPNGHLEQVISMVDKTKRIKVLQK